jgi:hypothetical protein
MTRPDGEAPAMWVLAAVAALVLGLAAVVVGLNILPSPSKALEGGTLVPLLVAWGIVLVGVVASVRLAKFILTARPRS